MWRFSEGFNIDGSNMIRDQESLKLSTNRETYINVFKIFFIYQLMRMFKKSNSPLNMYISYKLAFFKANKDINVIIVKNFLNL